MDANFIQEVWISVRKGGKRGQRVVTKTLLEMLYGASQSIVAEAYGFARLARAYIETKDI